MTGLPLLAAAVFLGAFGASLAAATEGARLREAIRSRRRVRHAVLTAGAGEITGPPRRQRRLLAAFAGFLHDIVDLIAPADVWGVRPPAARLVGIAFGIAFGVAVVVGLLMKFPVWLAAVLSVLSGPGSIRFITARADQRQRDRFEDLFPESIDHLTRMLQAGLPVTTAIRRLAIDAEAPVNKVYEETANWLDVGMPLSQAMLLTGRNLKIKPFDFFGAALSIQSGSGGNLIDTLESLASIMRERQLQSAKARALTGEARTTATIITMLPLGASLVMRVVLPDYIGVLFHGRQNLMILGGACACYLTGVIAVRTLLSRLRVT